ncbi:MAG TPA: hypothetical protein VM389_14580, partial [Phycisphaerae bacterium]|nr:hypothetical protein [Phycisphaerae bacterium]
YAVNTDGGTVTLADTHGLVIGAVADSGGFFGAGLAGIDTVGAGNAGDVDLLVTGTDEAALIILDNILANGGGAAGSAGDINIRTGATVTPLADGVNNYYRPNQVIRFGDETLGKTILVEALGVGAGQNGAIQLNNINRVFGPPGAGTEGMGIASIWGKVAANGGVEFRSGYFGTGRNEKFSSQGGILIDVLVANVPGGSLPAGAVAGDAEVSDLVARNDLTVRAVRVDLQNGRGPDNLIRATAAGAFQQITGDREVAFLAGDQIVIQGAATNMPAGFVAGGSGGTVFGAPADVLAVPLNILLNDLGRLGNTDYDGTGVAMLGIAARTTPPVVGGLATSLAGALPDAEVDVTLSRSVEAGQREDLVRHLGIFTKDPNEQELVDYLSGRRFFMDTPEFRHLITAGQPTPDPDKTSPSQHKVSIDRLPGELARKALEAYRALYWRQQVDQKTGRKVWTSVAADIRKTLQDSVDAFAKAHGGKFDPAGYRKWVAATSDQKQADQLMQQLSSLFRQVELLGLGPAELDISHSMLARPIKPRGVTLQQLIDAVRLPEQGGAVAAATR